jgi:hypothetical protein
LGDLGSPTHPQQHLRDNKNDVWPGQGVVYNKHYSLAGVVFEVSGENKDGWHNGLKKTKYITVTGKVADTVRKIKLTLGSPDKKAYNFTRSANPDPKLTMASPIDTISSLPANEFTISVWVQMDVINESPLFGLKGDGDDYDNHWIQFTSATVMCDRNPSDNNMLP